MIFKGRVAWVFGDHFDIDLIIGVRNIGKKGVNLKHLCMKDFDSEFEEKVCPGDLVVAGKNFGYGHPHRQGIAALKEVGIKAIIAQSFAPTFYRGYYGSGVTLLSSNFISKKIARWDEMEINLFTYKIIHIRTNKAYSILPIPKAVKQVIDAGGLLLALKKEVGNKEVLHD